MAKTMELMAQLLAAVNGLAQSLQQSPAPVPLAPVNGKRAGKGNVSAPVSPAPKTEMQLTGNAVAQFLDVLKCSFVDTFSGLTKEFWGIKYRDAKGNEKQKGVKNFLLACAQGLDGVSKREAVLATYRSGNLVAKMGNTNVTVAFIKESGESKQPKTIPISVYNGLREWFNRPASKPLILAICGTNASKVTPRKARQA